MIEINSRFFVLSSVWVVRGVLRVENGPFEQVKIVYGLLMTIAPLSFIYFKPLYISLVPWSSSPLATSIRRQPSALATRARG